MWWRGALRAAARGSINIPEQIWQLRDRQLHRKVGHPLCTTKKMVEGYHRGLGRNFEFCDNIDSVTETKACFDDLLVGIDHPSRSLSDTYYVNTTQVLRPHMTAHDVEWLKNGKREFVLTGDVFRRDEIDRSHYPAFHQIDGVRVVTGSSEDQMIADLKSTLEGLARHLFGAKAKLRWVDAYFPFTDPSFELEVKWNGEWLELLGCGLLRRGVLDAGGVASDEIGWAYGLGLDRLTMVLFGLPDIRLLWTEDPRFINQFVDGEVATFRPYSHQPVCYKDISFWLADGFHENDFFELVRHIGGDLVEQVELVDQFEKPGVGRSRCYRVSYRSMDRNLTNLEVNALQSRVRAEAADQLGVVLR